MRRRAHSIDHAGLEIEELAQKSSLEVGSTRDKKGAEEGKCKKLRVVTPVVRCSNFIVVPRPMPAALRRYLMVVPRPLPAAPLVERRMYNSWCPRRFPKRRVGT